MWFRGADERFFEESYRRAPQLLAYFQNEPHLRPYLTFAARPGIESAVLNTDAEGFRISASPLGLVDSRRWRDGGGGLVLGGSFTFGVGATCDGATMPSRLAFLSGSPQLNLGVCAGNSLQELIAAVPFLDAATTVVACSGANTVLTSLQSLGLNDLYGPLFFEAALATVGTLPIGEIVHLTTAARRGGRAGRHRPDRPEPRPPATRVAPRARTDADLVSRLDAALGRQVRDLDILSRACQGRARVLFCLQPFAASALRDLAPEERELFDLHARHQGAWSDVRDFVAARWDAYAARLAGACARLRVPFLHLSADRFEGWSFLDHVHMTDHGYRQAADLVWEALR